MTEPTRAPEASGGPEKTELEPVDVKTRRDFLTMLALDEELIPSIAAQMDKTEVDLIKMALRAIASELVHTSLTTETTAESVATIEACLPLTGAIVAGLMGFKTADEPAENPADDEDLTPQQAAALDDETSLRRFRLVAQRTGAIIRESAGLEPLVGAAS